jgi:hypothetical protein
VSWRASDSETDGGAKQAGQGRSPHPFFDCTAKEIDPGARKARDPARDLSWASVRICPGRQ